MPVAAVVEVVDATVVVVVVLVIAAAVVVVVIGAAPVHAPRSNIADTHRPRRGRADSLIRPLYELPRLSKRKLSRRRPVGRGC